MASLLVGPNVFREETGAKVQHQEGLRNAKKGRYEKAAESYAGALHSLEKSGDSIDVRVQSAAILNDYGFNFVPLAIATTSLKTLRSGASPLRQSLDLIGQLLPDQTEKGDRPDHLYQGDELKSLKNVHGTALSKMGELFAVGELLFDDCVGDNYADHFFQDGRLSLRSSNNGRLLIRNSLDAARYQLAQNDQEGRDSWLRDAHHDVKSLPGSIGNIALGLQISKWQMWDLRSPEAAMASLERRP